MLVSPRKLFLIIFALQEVMKIGYFTSIEGWGGSEIQLRDLIISMRKAGNNVILFGVRGSRLFWELEEMGLQCVSWKTLPRSAGVMGQKPSGAAQNKLDFKRVLLGILPVWLKLLAGNLKEVVLLVALFRQYPVDIMHINIHGYEVAGIACLLCRIPCVGFYEIMPTVDKYWFRRLLIKYLSRSFNHICSLSRAAMEAWIATTGASREKFSFIWNGIDIKKFDFNREITTWRVQGPFRLISVGRLHPMKGYKYLIKAMSLIDDSAVTLDIFGEGEEWQELISRISELGLQDRVVLKGHVENPESYLQSAHCFVMVSVSHESFCAALAESMASGLPVITSDFGPFPELNENGVTGLVVPVADSAALADAIKRLRNDPKLCFDMGKAAREKAGTSFQKEDMILKTITMYRNVINQLNGS